MKILLCGFDDLCHGAGKLRADQIGLQHVPFAEDSIVRSDVVAVLGGGRALVLKDSRDRPGNMPHIIHAAALLARIESEASK